MSAPVRSAKPIRPGAAAIALWLLALVLSLQAYAQPTDRRTFLVQCGRTYESFVHPHEGNWVGVRPTSARENAFIQVGDHTPMKLTYPFEDVSGKTVPEAYSYVIRVEYRGWLWQYADEHEVAPLVDDPELRPYNLHFDCWYTLRVGVLITLSMLGASLVVAVLVRARRRSKRLSDQLRLTMYQMDQMASSKIADTLPPILGKRLRTQHGREFAILRLTGTGSMGAVFEAAPRGQGAPAEERWAVKIPFRAIQVDDESRGRFLREAEICAAVPHPGLVQVLDWGSFDSEDGETDWPFIVMEMMDGRTLRHVLQAEKGQGLAVGKAVGWLREMVLATHHMHEAGIVHRDLKPENVFITPAGHVKIADFGLAGRVDRHSMTRTGDAFGTPHYMSPEHLDARTTTGASDTYSMGVMTYEMLSGEVPFQADSAIGVITAMLNRDAPPLAAIRPDIPARLTDLVSSMMERDASLRPSTEEILEVLDSLRKGRKARAEVGY